MPAYRVELAHTGRAGCNGRKPCNGTKIGKGELRLGVWVEIHGNGSFKWRHWGCTTPEVIKHWKEDFKKPSEIDGFDEIPEEYQQKITDAWNEGHVKEGDVPASARVEKVEENEPEDEKPATKKKATKKATAEAHEDGGSPEAPKKQKTPAKGTKAKDEPKDKNENEAEHSLKKKRKAPVKQAKKEEPEEHEEPAAEETPKKKRKAPAKKDKKGEPSDELEEEHEKSKRGRGRPKKAKA
ncbi:uncharacterized protein IAS62_000979 [Cryptococcus decagattii]|uniref:PARP-type domain-containing protein n=1 Tax=Cryptococcus decagattii TaxID=1859122 RepID=A0ABZ2AMK5_9TREE